MSGLQFLLIALVILLGLAVFLAIVVAVICMSAGIETPLTEAFKALLQFFQ